MAEPAVDMSPDLGELLVVDDEPFLRDAVASWATAAAAAASAPSRRSGERPREPPVFPFISCRPFWVGRMVLLATIVGGGAAGSARIACEFRVNGGQGAGRRAFTSNSQASHTWPPCWRGRLAF